MTQEQIAEATELSAVYISQIERGNRKLSLDTLVKLANCLNTSVDALLRDSIDEVDDLIINEFRLITKDRSYEDMVLIIEYNDLFVKTKIFNFIMNHNITFVTI